MANDLACPSCHGQDCVQSIPGLQATGVSTVHGTDNFFGVGISPSGLVPFLDATLMEQAHRTALTGALVFEPGHVPTARPLLLGSLLVIPSLAIGAATLTNVKTHLGID